MSKQSNLHSGICSTKTLLLLSLTPNGCSESKRASTFLLPIRPTFLQKVFPQPIKNYSKRNSDSPMIHTTYSFSKVFPCFVRVGVLHTLPQKHFGLLKLSAI